MRNTVAHPLTDKEVLDYLERKLAEAMASPMFGSMEPMILNHLIQSVISGDTTTTAKTITARTQ